MIQTYILEGWDPKTNKYTKLGEYSTIERAEIMFNKRYMKPYTRRLIRITTEVLYQEKKNTFHTKENK